MDSLAHVTEREFKLPHGTCRAFALQESGYDSSATRVETGYFNAGSRYALAITRESIQFLADHQDTEDSDQVSSLAVERAQRSISYGLFQLMGETLRQLGYARVIIAPSVREQFYYFGVFASGLLKHYHTLARAASAYNTGNPDKTDRPYVKHVLAYQKKFNY